MKKNRKMCWEISLAYVRNGKLLTISNYKLLLASIFYFHGGLIKCSSHVICRTTKNIPARVKNSFRYSHENNRWSPVIGVLSWQH